MVCFVVDSIRAFERFQYYFKTKQCYMTDFLNFEPFVSQPS